MALGTGLVAVVADDDQDIRTLLEIQLTRWGFAVHTAADGHEALASIEQHQPHLVLLDVSMPGRDGLEVLRIVREQQPPLEDGGPAVLLVTARDGGQDVATGLEMGADDYVRKPFHIAELRQRLHRSVDNARRFARLESVRRAVSQPRVISVPGVDVASSTEPIDGAGAGGDLMVVTEAPGGHVVAVIGDAMGHGPGAAARAAYTRTLLSSTARYEADPARILTLTNSAMGADPDAASIGRDTEFVTACAVSLHPETGLLRWASAGHSGPWVVSGGRVVLARRRGRRPHRPSAGPGPGRGLPGARARAGARRPADAAQRRAGRDRSGRRRLPHRRGAPAARPPRGVGRGGGRPDPDEPARLRRRAAPRRRHRDGARPDRARPRGRLRRRRIGVRAGLRRPPVMMGG